MGGTGIANLLQSFAHEGKPYPVDRKTYDRSIEMLRKGLTLAKIGQDEKMRAFRRLSLLCR